MQSLNFPSLQRRQILLASCFLGTVLRTEVQNHLVEQFSKKKPQNVLRAILSNYDFWTSPAKKKEDNTKFGLIQG